MTVIRYLSQPDMWGNNDKQHTIKQVNTWWSLTPSMNSQTPVKIKVYNCYENIIPVFDKVIFKISRKSWYISFWVQKWTYGFWLFTIHYSLSQCPLVKELPVHRYRLRNMKLLVYHTKPTMVKYIPYIVWTDLNHHALIFGVY